MRCQSEFNALQAKFTSVQQELAQVQQKNAEVQRTFEAERAAWQQDRKTLEGTIFELRTSEKTSDSERAAREDEVRQLEERARSAEDRYGREVLAHAESIKKFRILPQDAGNRKKRCCPVSAMVHGASPEKAVVVEADEYIVSTVGGDI